MGQGASERFKALMLRWMREDPDGCLTWRGINSADVTAVVHVSTYGTDWAGDTEGGFYSECDTALEYVLSDGTKKTVTLTGGDLESMWRFVMREV